MAANSVGSLLGPFDQATVLGGEARRVHATADSRPPLRIDPEAILDDAKLHALEP